MFSRLIEKTTLKRLENIQCGELSLTTPKGKTYSFKGKAPGPCADVQLNDWKAIKQLSNKGCIGFADGFKDDHFNTSNLASLLLFGLQNQHAIAHSGSWLFTQLSRLKYLTQLNSLSGSRKNISAHYDLGNDFYELWLDPTMSYSSGIYQDENDDLTQSQWHKYDRIIDRLNSDSGEVLEIGCGWGGFAERLLQDRQKDMAYKGITLSTEQHAYAKNRLDSSAEVVIEDYRIQEKKYDSIVSIEMFEAVGKKYWPTYFKKVKQCLKKSGKAMIQTITIRDDLFAEYEKSADMIRTYIFPGGLLPSQQEFKKQAERHGLQVTDSFEFGLDYAKTLDAWLKRFHAKSKEIMALGYDKHFMRIWEFYLAGCIATFSSDRTNVVQLELNHA